MTATTKTDRVVFTATAEWWQIRGGDFTLADAWQGADCERAAGVAEIDTDDTESWVCQIEAVDEEHTAIRAGDYVCCQGIGDDVVFVRLVPDPLRAVRAGVAALGCQ